MEYIVSGHSGHTAELIAVPRNVTVIFYAKKGETCYIPSDMESLNIVMKEMDMPEHGEFYTYGNRVNNYVIEFEPNNPYQGIFHLVNSIYYSVPSKEIVTMRDIFNFLQQDASPKTLYCMFCRGGQADKFRMQTANIMAPEGLNDNFDYEIAELLDVLSNASSTPEPEQGAEPILVSQPTTPILDAGPITPILIAESVAEAKMPAKRKSPKKSKSRKVQKHKAKKANRKTKKSNTKHESNSK